MRKSLQETEQLENYLLNRMEEQEGSGFRIHLLLNSGLQEVMDLQREAYNQISLYGRKKLKEELQEIQERLIRQPEKKAFWTKIKTLFT